MILARLMLATMLATTFIPPQAHAADTTEVASRQKLYMEFLGARGFEPEIDSDGDVRFYREFMGAKRMYFLRVSATDASFFELALAQFWPIESLEERQKALIVSNDVTAKTKVVKVYTAGDNVWATIEMFMADPTHFKDVFDRSISALDDGVTGFVTGMNN